MHRIYIGIDNGHTGTVAWVGENVHPTIIETPVRKEQSYTKKAQKMTRIDHERLTAQLKELIEAAGDASNVMVVMERPFTGTYASANVSAARAYEVTLVLVEQLKLPHNIVDSRQWQKVMLPVGIKGSDKLKEASATIALRLFPDQEKVIKKHKDADALLMAEWARRQQL